MYQGLQTSKRENQFKTLLLLILFPVFLWGVVFLVFWMLAGQGEQALIGPERLDFAYTSAIGILKLLVPVLLIWCVISFIFQRQLVFSFSGARAVTRAEEPEIYNIVENLCISRGLPVPKIGIIDEPGMNAFALGWRMENSRVVFTRGLLERLERKEIEAVTAHELTHIINKDSLLMLVMVVYIGAVALLGEILIRSGRSSSDEKKGNPLPLIGLALLILGYIAYPLLKLAISRRREYLADAGSVELTKDNQAMISALRKIAQKPEVPLENKQMSVMFIANPLDTSRFQTHPSIEERIKALESY